VNLDEVITSVAADADNGGVTLRAGEAERQSVGVGGRSMSRRKAVV